MKKTTVLTMVLFMSFAAWMLTNAVPAAAVTGNPITVTAPHDGPMPLCDPRDRACICTYWRVCPQQNPTPTAPVAVAVVNLDRDITRAFGGPEGPQPQDSCGKPDKNGCRTCRSSNSGPVWVCPN